MKEICDVKLQSIPELLFCLCYFMAKILSLIVSLPANFDAQSNIFAKFCMNKTQKQRMETFFTPKKCDDYANFVRSPFCSVSKTSALCRLKMLLFYESMFLSCISNKLQILRNNL